MQPTKCNYLNLFASFDTHATLRGGIYYYCSVKEIVGKIASVLDLTREPPEPINKLVPG